VEALDKFNTKPDSFDLVITDMTLPKMTGIDLSRELLKIRPNIPIILCSGIKDPDTEAQVKAMGIKAYIMKPLTKRELANAIRNTLDGEMDTGSI
jgi:DNA-binding NarL/FixJ family response regulator